MSNLITCALTAGVKSLMDNINYDLADHEAGAIIDEAIRLLTKARSTIADEVDVIYIGYLKDQKIPAIKILREINGLSLVDAKELVESDRGTVIKENITPSNAIVLINRLAYNGVRAEIRERSND